MFNIESLERGIEACKKNIAVFEEAIEKERATIKEYRGYIDKLEEKERQQRAAEANINIEVDMDGG